MTTMDLGSILVGVALSGLVALLVAWPVLRPRHVLEVEAQALDHLVAEREAILTALRDLDFDHATGKVSDGDYAPQRANLVSRGASVLRQIDQVNQLDQPPNHSDDELDRAIAARRKAAIAPHLSSQGRACPQCSAQIRPHDRFCPWCGQALTRICVRCGQPIRAEDRFCGHCGVRLPAVTEAVAK